MIVYMYQTIELLNEIDNGLVRAIIEESDHRVTKDGVPYFVINLT